MELKSKEKKEFVEYVQLQQHDNALFTLSMITVFGRLSFMLVFCFGALVDLKLNSFIFLVSGVTLYVYFWFVHKISLANRAKKIEDILWDKVDKECQDRSIISNHNIYKSSRVRGGEMAAEYEPLVWWVLTVTLLIFVYLTS